MIDGCKESCDLAKRVLDAAGHTAVLTGEPRRALTLCEDVHFDLVICEFLLLSQHNSQLSAEFEIEPLWTLVDRYPSLPIVVLTNSRSSTSTLLKLGFAAVVSRPFESQQLLATIETALTKGTVSSSSCPGF